MDRPQNIPHDDSESAVTDFDAGQFEDQGLSRDEGVFGLSDELFHRDDADDAADMFENILDNM